MYLDDTYVADAPRAALETMLEGDDLAQLWSGVESNKSKRCMWAPDPRSLDAVRDHRVHPDPPGGAREGSSGPPAAPQRPRGPVLVVYHTYDGSL